MEDGNLSHESVLENNLKDRCDQCNNVAVEIHCHDVLFICSFAVENDFSIFNEACIKTDQNINYQDNR